jgi:two-component sensor histidine kinase
MRLQPLVHAAAIALENSRLYAQAREDAETRAILLQEVNHRVKNNLTALVGMLSIERRQAQTVSRRDYTTVLDDLITRIRGLSAVHQTLSDSNWAPLPLTELTQHIVASALQAVSTDRQVETTITGERALVVTPKEAHNLAIIINDLTTNVIKYATRPGETAHLNVHIGLTEAEGRVLFEFRDDGPGFPEVILQSESGGRQVGLHLIENTVRHSLRGSIQLYNDHGAVVSIHFARETE